MSVPIIMPSKYMKCSSGLALCSQSDHDEICRTIDGWFTLELGRMGGKNGMQ